MPDHMLLPLLVFAVAILYSSVGHGGASGYLAVMTLVAFHPERMASTALVLNVLVAGLGAVNFGRAGHVSARLLWPFAIASVPAAFLGGALVVPIEAYALLLAGALLFAAFRLALSVPRAGTGSQPWPEERVRVPRTSIALTLGSAIGLLSGIVGVGGGIFLSPLVILLGWAGPKGTAGVSAAFILVNSIAGLLGRASRGGLATEALLPLVLAALAGGILGSYSGARHLPGVWLRRLLALVLVVATVKLVQRAL